MTVTILAVVFLIVVAAITLAGYRYIIKQGKPVEEVNTERCSLCRQKFETSKLLERQVGDYRLLYFCRDCVLKLYADLVMKN